MKGSLKSVKKKGQEVIIIKMEIIIMVNGLIIKKTAPVH